MALEDAKAAAEKVQAALAGNDAVEATEEAIKAIGLYKSVANREGESGVLGMYLSKPPKDAVAAVEAAMTAFKEKKDAKGQAAAMLLLIQLKISKQDPTVLDDVLKCLKDVQALYKGAGAEKEEEGVLEDILSYYLGKDDAAAASATKTEILALYTGKKEQAAALVRIAETYAGMREKAEAEKLVMEAVSMFDAAKDVDGKMEAYQSLINILVARQEFDEALAIADQMVGASDDKAKKGSAMKAIAEVHFAKDDGYTEGISALKKAAALYKEAGDNKAGAETMQMIAETTFSMGDLDEAVAAAKKGASLFSSAGLLAMEVSLLQVVVNSYLAKGSEQQAMSAANDALEKAKKAADPEAEVSALQSTAQVYLANGDLSAATTAATESLTISREKKLALGEASANLILANAIFAMDPGSLEGVQCAKQAVTLFDSLGQVSSLSSALYVLANACFTNFDLEEGLKYAREALACFRQMGDESNQEILKQTIEQARFATAEYRKQTPKKPMPLPTGGGTVASGPQASSSESTVSKELLEVAASGRKYWGVPKHVAADPAVGAAERAPSHAIIWGQTLSDNVPTQTCVEFGDLVATMAKGDVAKIPIVVLTSGVNGRMTGEMMPCSITSVSAVTVWGMVRTIRQEIPQVQVMLYDFSNQQTAAQIPRNVRMPYPMVQESAYYHGARWEPQLAQVPSLFRRELKRDNLTGGGSGTKAGDPKKSAKFMRRSFNWTGPSHKLDYAWYRQEWRAVGPATGDIGPMPPPPPCRAIRCS